MKNQRRIKLMILLKRFMVSIWEVKLIQILDVEVDQRQFHGLMMDLPLDNQEQT